MRKISMLLLAAVVVVVTACSSTSDTASGEKPSGVIADSYVVKATVQSINYKTRMATFKTDDGIVFSKRIEDDVKKIQQIKKGDVITARYIESIAVEVRKPDEAKKGAAASTYSYVDVNEAGKKPHKTKVQVSEMRAVVIDVKYSKRLITLQSPDGRTATFTVSDEVENFKNIKKKDEVVVTYTESVMYSIGK